ncbi:hypothetical protein QY97_01008 [Bacillus thermotolerans]|nr:hypothetical protein QY97_01008 [Bacillus thermotolerans]
MSTFPSFYYKKRKYKEGKYAMFYFVTIAKIRYDKSSDSIKNEV